MSLAVSNNLSSNLVIDKKTKFNYNNVLSFLSENGYVRVSGVRESGEFSVKGDIIDIFPTGYEYPIRINIFDSDKEKRYNLNTGKMINY